MLSFSDIRRKYFNTGIFAPRVLGLSSAAHAFSTRQYSTENVPTEPTPKSTANKEAQALYNMAVRREMGPIASAKPVHRYKGNFKYLAGVMAVFVGIYYYSIWKVGQDDFSDVDAQGNVREKV